MRTNPYIIKANRKFRKLLRRFSKPAKVLMLDEFFARCWNGPAPESVYFVDRDKPRFFFAAADSDLYARALRAHFADSCRAINRRATNAAAHVFDLLGSGERFLGERIEWHSDFKTGRQWPRKFFAKIALVDFNDDSDVKLPWELSRLQFLTDLGRAYWLSDNSAFKREFMSILTDWERENPVDMGVNWTCSMELAIRAINIIWGLHYFSNAEELDLNFMRTIIRLLYYHGLHIENNLEVVVGGANSNHLVADYLGLFYLGILFPEFDRAAQWQRLGLQGLENEIQDQVNDDGVDYECSTSYHRLVLEMFLSAFILGRINGICFSEKYRERLYKMIHFSAAITAPSGNAPLIGDNDDGFIVKLATDNPGDHRPLTDIGLLMFGERVPFEIPISEERLWYLGPDSLVGYHSSGVSKSALFKASGYAVIRSDDFHLVFNAAGIPAGGLGGHKHNDLLSLTLEIDGIPFLIDPGTACYSADFRLRNLSRSTRYHNTVSVDDEEQNRFREKLLFYMSRDASARVNLWADAENSAVVSASHTGYSRLQNGITHKRTIWYSGASSSLLLMDEFLGRGSAIHKFDLRFITPLLTVYKIENATFIISGNRSRQLVIKTSTGCLHDSAVIPFEYFPRYGIRRKAALIQCTYRSRLPFRIATTIASGNRLYSPGEQIRLAESELKGRFSAVEAAI